MRRCYSRFVEFEWMVARRRQSQVRGLRRAAMYRKELAQRAAIFYRLGYTRDDAVERLTQNVAWDFETGGRPESLTDAEIASIVDQTFARRPAH
jgi:hypothetical protein